MHCCYLGSHLFPCWTVCFSRASFTLSSLQSFQCWSQAQALGRALINTDLRKKERGQERVKLQNSAFLSFTSRLSSRFKISSVYRTVHSGVGNTRSFPWNLIVFASPMLAPLTTLPSTKSSSSPLLPLISCAVTYTDREGEEPILPFMPYLDLLTLSVGAHRIIPKVAPNLQSNFNLSTSIPHSDIICF